MTCYWGTDCEGSGLVSSAGLTVAASDSLLLLVCVTRYTTAFNGTWYVKLMKSDPVTVRKHNKSSSIGLALLLLIAYLGVIELVLLRFHALLLISVFAWLLNFFRLWLSSKGPSYTLCTVWLTALGTCGVSMGSSNRRLKARAFFFYMHGSSMIHVAYTFGFSLPRLFYWYCCIACSCTSCFVDQEFGLNRKLAREGGPYSLRTSLPLLYQQESHWW